MSEDGRFQYWKVQEGIPPFHPSRLSPARSGLLMHHRLRSFIVDRKNETIVTHEMTKESKFKKGCTEMKSINVKPSADAGSLAEEVQSTIV